MKIAQTTPFVQAVGGIPVHVRQLDNAYRKAGHQTIVLSNDLPKGAHHRLPDNRILRLPACLLKLMAFHPDMIHVHSQVHMLIPSLLYRCLNSRCRVIFNFHSHPYMAPALPGSKPLKPSYSGMSRVLAQFLLNHSDKVVGPSQPLFDDLKKTCGITFKKSVLIPPGVAKPTDDGADAAAELKQKYRLDRRHPVFASTGVLVWDWKVAGHKMCIEAMPYILEKFPEASLIVAGKGRQDYADLLRETVVKLKLENNVILAGYVPSVPGLMRVADIYLHMALYESTTPMAVLEAMLHGKPIVGVNSGGTPHSLKHMQTGLLVAPDPRELAQAAITLASDPALAEKLGDAAKAYVHEHHDWDRIAARLQTVLPE